MRLPSAFCTLLYGNVQDIVPDATGQRRIRSAGQSASFSRTIRNRYTSITFAYIS